MHERRWPHPHPQAEAPSTWGTPACHTCPACDVERSAGQIEGMQRHIWHHQPQLPATAHHEKAQVGHDLRTSGMLQGGGDEDEVSMSPHGCCRGS